MAQGFVLVLVAYAFSACDSLQEPERFIDDDARAPQVVSLDIGALEPGRHVAGTVSIMLRLDSLGNRVERVVFVVDDQEVHTLTAPPYVFDLDTRRWDEGSHDVTAGVYLQDENLGLGSVLAVPPLVLTTPLVFDQTLPTSLDVTSVELSDEGTRVTWEESADANFYAYLVVRERNWSADYWATEWNFPVVDTVYDRSATTYLDARVPAVYGAESTYHVAVWNRAEASNLGAGGSVTYGPERPDIKPTQPAVFSASGEVMYAFSLSADLLAVNTATNEVLRRTTARVLGGGGAYFARLTSDPGTTRLYAGVYGLGGTYGASILVLDPASFDVLYTLTPPENTHAFAVDSEQRVFGVADETLTVLEGTTGEVLSRLPSSFADPSHVMGLSPDGRALYVYEYLHADAHAVRRVDVSGAQPILAERYEFRPSPGIGYDYSLGPEGHIYLRADRDLIEILDGESLQVRNRLDLTLGYSNEIRSFEATSDRLFVAHTIEEDAPTRKGRVVEYDLDGLRRVRSWDFLSMPEVVTTSGRHHLYVFTYEYGNNHGWVVPLEN